VKSSPGAPVVVILTADSVIALEKLYVRVCTGAATPTFTTPKLNTCASAATAASRNGIRGRRRRKRRFIHEFLGDSYEYLVEKRFLTPGEGGFRGSRDFEELSSPSGYMSILA
jgi:hypothetical protein